MLLYRQVLFALSFACALSCVSAPAWARASGDMFEDSSWNSAERPEVPSDGGRRGRDLLNSPPVMLNANADLFDGMRARSSTMPQDMLIPHPVTVYPSTRIFQPWANR